MTQMQLNFEPGLTAQFKTLEDVLSAAVYASRTGLQGCAAAADQSPSELSRRLNKVDALPLRVVDMTAVLDETKDLRPVYWLIERYLQDPQARRNALEQQFAQLLPAVITMAEQLGLTGTKGKR